MHYEFLMNHPAAAWSAATVSVWGVGDTTIAATGAAGCDGKHGKKLFYAVRIALGA